MYVRLINRDMFNFLVHDLPAQKDQKLQKFRVLRDVLVMCNKMPLCLPLLLSLLQGFFFKRPSWIFFSALIYIIFDF